MRSVSRSEMTTDIDGSLFAESDNINFDNENGILGRDSQVAIDSTAGTRRARSKADGGRRIEARREVEIEPSGSRRARRLAKAETTRSRQSEVTKKTSVVGPRPLLRQPSPIVEPV
jgi:hypothetical protein